MLASKLDQRYDNVMDPKTVKYSLGNPRSIIAETFGEPGRRTFRLVIESGEARSDIWLEKEQLLQLGVYLQEAIRTLSDDERDKDCLLYTSPSQRD